MSFEITFENKKYKFENPIRVSDFLKNNKNVICIKFNNRIRELSYNLHKDGIIVPLTLKDRDSKPTYDASLRFVFAMACYRLWPKEPIRFSYSISRTIFLEFVNPNISFTENKFIELENEVRNIVKKDYPFNRIKSNNAEVIDIYKSEGFNEKVEMMKYRPENKAHYYECDGYKNYMYNRMVPSSGYVNRWNLIRYNHGVLIQYPRFDNNGEIPEFKDAPLYHHTLEEAKKWSKIIGTESVLSVNKMIETRGDIDFINLAESLQNRQITLVVNEIEKKKNKVKIICIAGPSSSGKTTFANKLRIEMLSRGLNPIRISLDDYYIDRVDIPTDEDGEKDFETIEALNIVQLNKDMFNLIKGEEVILPAYDFKLGKSIVGRKLKLEKDQCIIIEGIHALNKITTEKIPPENLFKIFISPQAQLRLDSENPLSTTDLRLLRRIVRDHKFRGFPVSETISMWPKVRRGEFNWIYETQEEADFVFNSYLSYELCALKKHAMPLLEKVNYEEEYFPVVERLIRMLKYFKEIPDTWIPCNSLIREFIGGSCFQD